MRTISKLPDTAHYFRCRLGCRERKKVSIIHHATGKLYWPFIQKSLLKQELPLPLGCQESPFLSVLPGATTNHCHVMSKFWEEGARIRRSYTVKRILVHNEQISSIKAPLKKRKKETHKSSSHRRLKITWYLYLSMYYTKY